MCAFVSVHNERHWARRATARSFRKDTQVFAAEATILREISAEFRNGTILDIGIGGGRSTGQLLSISRNYIGIDYSTAMVDLARKTHPSVDIRHADARDLSAFRNQQFDLIWFSFNGIDYVSHEDRLKILSEVRRVLKPTGAFCFSTHNRNYPVRSAHDLSHISLSRNPLTLSKSAIVYFMGLFNSFSRRRHEIHTDDYAILNDEGNCYRLLTYYISSEKTVAQLNHAGFSTVHSYGMDGKVAEGSSRHVDSFMVHYLARS